MTRGITERAGRGSLIPDVEGFVCVGLAGIAAAFIIRSLITIHANYFIPVYWDEWEFVRELASPQSYTGGFLGLFVRHNEHILATTKLFLWADYLFFRLTNGPLIVSILFLDCVNAWLLAALLFTNRRRDKLFWTIWLIFVAASLSLVSWANLLWAYEPQVPLVLLGALAAIRIAIAMPAADDLKGMAWLAVLLLAIGFSIFSMANGIVVPVSVLLLLILFRTSLLKCGITIAVSILYVALFFSLIRGAPQIGDLSLRTPFNIAYFFFAMIGGPLSGDTSHAAVLGAALVLALCGLAIFYAAGCWRQSRQVDRGLAGLYALALFLCASAAAAAWGRTPLGVETALSSRYMTPMLFLWMAAFAIVVRISWILQKASFAANAAVWIAVVAACGAMAWSNLQPGPLDSLRTESAKIRQAAYFLAFGVQAPTELRVLYPHPPEISRAIVFLRDNRLNLFARNGGLPMPEADEIETIELSAPAPICSLAAVDKITRLDSTDWKITGWASDEHRRAPRWLLTFDGSNNLLGFTVPTVPRPDVARAIGARGEFRGFEAPLHLGDASHGPYSLVAIAANGGRRCRVVLPSLSSGN